MTHAGPSELLSPVEPPSDGTTGGTDRESHHSVLAPAERVADRLAHKLIDAAVIISSAMVVIG